MKKTVINITSISLAFLVLLSTFSFTVEKHYCGDFLMDVSYVGHAEGCGMEKDLSSKTIKKPCCKDEVHKIEGQDELQKTVADVFDFKVPNVQIASAAVMKELFVEIVSNKPQFHDFSPPDISLDYQVLFQSFLI